MKQCTKCKQVKIEIEFYKINGKTKDGLTCYCKECCKISSNNWRKNNPIKYKETKIKYIQKFPKRFWADKTLRDHKNRGNIINITFNDLCDLVKNINNCEICESKLEWNYINKKGKTQYNSPSLDRKNNENIINIDNIMILCHKCNSTKRNRTLGEFIEYCKNVVKKFGDE